MSRQTKKKDETGNVCGDCSHGVPFAEQWNIGSDGRPITLHCHLDPKNVKRGIFPKCAACGSFSQK